MGERDPRVTPMAGDVLRDCFGAIATVDHVHSDVVTRTRDDVQTNVDIRYWRGWYVDATIVKKAEDA